MIDETLDELRSSTAKAHEALRRELAKVRTGRAHPSLLDSVRVEAYGSQSPISQMATVSVPEPRLLTVKPWDKSQLKAIEKAIVQTPLGLNPQNDGELIRIPLPPLTEERRKEMVKLAKKHGEDCKVAIRKARRDANDFIKGLVDDKEIGKDDGDRAYKDIDDAVQQATSTVDDIVAKKEHDIMEV
ncbi:MAG: ribosome recycling factor [Myxococcales bacterium]|nr:ribosome recycling factor [Myxococcales bacterium]